MPWQTYTRDLLVAIALAIPSVIVLRGSALTPAPPSRAEADTKIPNASSTRHGCSLGRLAGLQSAVVSLDASGAVRTSGLPSAASARPRVGEASSCVASALTSPLVSGG